MTVSLRLQEEPLAHQLPYWWLSDGVYVCHDGSLALGFRLEGLDTTTMPDAEVNTVAELLRSALNALPVDLTVQFLRRVMPVPATTWDAYAAQLRTTDPLLRELRLQTTAHLRAQPFRASETYLFLTRPKALGRFGTRKATGIPRLLNRLFSAVDPATLTRETHAHALESLRLAVAPFIQALAATRVRLEPLDDQGLARVAYAFLNPSRARRGLQPDLVDALPPAGLSAEQQPLYRPLSLREQLAHSAVSWSADTLFLDEPAMPHRILALKALPPHTVASGMRVAERLPCEHWLAVSVTALDTEARYGSLERRRNRAKVAAGGYATDVRADNQARELESAMHALVANDQRLFDLSMHVLFGAPDLVELDRRTQVIVDTFARRHMPLVTAHQAQFFAWRGMLPGNGHQAPHTRTVLTANAADFLPVYQPWRGAGRPLFYVHHRGEPYALDIADPKRNTWNSLVFGGSGGGKSFLVLSLINSSMLGMGSDLIVVDVGGGEVGSYYRLCKLLGGDFVDLALDGANAVNPFPDPATLYLDADGKPSADPNPLRLQFLVNITKLLVTDARNPALGRVGDAVLLAAISAAYRTVKTRAPRYDDLVTALNELDADADDQAEARRIAKVLRAALAGPIGKLINNPAAKGAAAKRNRFTVFDLKGLDVLGDLAPVMLLVVSAHIWNMVGRKRDRLAWLVYDECWALMRYPTAAEVQAELYRTARKLDVGVISVTQKLADFMAVPGAQAIVSNSNLNLLLRHNSDDIPAVAKVLDLNPRETDLVRHLKNEKGHYAEFFVRQTDAGSAVLRYSPSPWEYWCNTTDARDRQLEQQALAACGGDRLRALQQLVSTYPNGAAGGARKTPHVP
jgi:conjugal transfer ATP-binding protein TraC